MAAPSSLTRLQLTLEPAQLLIRPPQLDERGSFRRLWSQSEYADVLPTAEFVEDNVAVSRRGVLRGLHFDFRQAKFIQVVVGKIFETILDLRADSPNFGQTESFVMTAEHGEQLFLPAGYAHGYYVLSEEAVMTYKHTAAFDPAFDGALLWSDPLLSITWPIQDGAPILSERDRQAPVLREAIRLGRISAPAYFLERVS